MHYRADIDGLRGVAVFSVVLFHFDIALFGGGFAGVDIFFVISGFLITSLIQLEIKAGTFSLPTFYERRIRRIFPALFALLVLVSCLAWTLLLAPDLRQYSLSLAATALLGVNFVFWRTTAYFDSAEEMKPLLHLWSLSLEEQFYLVFPVLLMIVLRLAGKRAVWVIIGTALLSFLGWAFFANSRPSMVFYLPFFRAWELLLGAFIALLPLSARLPHFWRDVLSLLGIVLIALGLFTPGAETSSPAVSVLLASAGSALLIFCGKGGTSLAGRLLSVRPLLHSGLISYSLYLWHWPLFVLARYYAVRDLTLGEKGLLVLCAILLAILSWRFVERPFRGRSGLLSRASLFQAAAAATALLVLVGMAGYLTNGMPARFPSRISLLAAQIEEPVPYRDTCFAPSLEAPVTGRACRLGREGAPAFLLWGDSHALALAPAVDQAAFRSGRTGLLVGKSACPPLMGMGDTGCRAYNDKVMALLAHYPGIDTVILAGRWTRAAGVNGWSLMPATAALSQADAFGAGLERTLRELLARGIAVKLVRQVPEIGWPVPSAMARTSLYGHDLPASPSLLEHQMQQGMVSSHLDSLPGRYPAQLLDPAEMLCPAGICLVQQDGRPLYRDHHHLNPHGAALLAALFEKAF